MSGDLHRLVYHSRNGIPGDAEALAAAVTSILAKSQTNDRRADVTGAPMFNARCFAHVLKGPRSAIRDTFEPIQ